MIVKMGIRTISAALAGALFAAPAVAVQSHVELMTKFAQETAQAWTNDPEIIAAIKAQNAKHANINQSDIDRHMDRDHRQFVVAVGGWPDRMVEHLCEGLAAGVILG